MKVLIEFIGDYMSKKLTWIEKLETMIPGFSGYKKRELIREDDRLIRSYVVDLLSDARRNLEEAAASILDFDFKLARRIEDLISNVRLTIDKLRYSEAGYAPHYSRIHIELSDLKKVRDIDGKLVELAEEIKELSVKVLRSAKVSTVKNEVILRINEVLSKINDVIDRRIKVFKGV